MVTADGFARRAVDITVHEMGDADWHLVQSILQEGIADGNATFETAVPDWQTWDATHLPSGRLVARMGQAAVGWAALSQVSRRSAYSGVAEVSVYVAATARGLGIGKLLLSELIGRSERAGIWTLQASIFPENSASLALHMSCGFRQVGRRERLGCLHGVWRDVILLERRSSSVGAVDNIAVT